jgi:hypothetical protein
MNRYINESDLATRRAVTGAGALTAPTIASQLCERRPTTGRVRSKTFGVEK